MKADLILKNIGKPPYKTQDSINKLNKLIQKYKGDVLKYRKASYNARFIFF